MENISIKVHPPWYARGTPVINPRDGPPMAESEKPLFAIRGGPSARGNAVEVGRQKSEVGSRKPEDRNRGNPRGKTRPWLTLKTTFFNTQNSVFCQWYAQSGRVEKIVAMISLCNFKTRRVDKIIGDKICISNKPRRGAMIIAIAKIEKTQTRRVAMIIDKNDVLRSQPRRGIMIIAMAKIVESETRRVEMIIENDMTYKPKTRRVDKIVGNKICISNKPRRVQ